MDIRLHTRLSGCECRELRFLLSDRPFLALRGCLLGWLRWRHLHKCLIWSSGCCSHWAVPIGGSTVGWCCQGLLRRLLLCTLVFIRVLTGGLLDVLVFFSEHARVSLSSWLWKVPWETFKFFYLFNRRLRRVLDLDRYFSPHDRFFLILLIFRLFVFFVGTFAGPLLGCWFEYLLGFLISHTCLYLFVWLCGRAIS